MIVIHTHALYKRIGYVIIHRPHFSSREGINSRCRRFHLLLFTCSAQPVAAMTVAVSAGRWRSIDRNRGSNRPFSTARCFIQHQLARESVFAIVVGCFSRVRQFLGRTETQTREMKFFQSIRTLWDISRDDRARITTCSLITATDRLKNYSIDIEHIFQIHQQ